MKEVHIKDKVKYIAGEWQRPENFVRRKEEFNNLRYDMIKELYRLNHEFMVNMIQQIDKHFDEHVQ